MFSRRHDRHVDRCSCGQRVLCSLRVLNALARDLRQGNKLNALERNAQARLDKFVGAGAGRDLATVNKVISAGNTIMSVLRSNAPIETHQQVGNRYMSTPRSSSSPFPTYVYPRYFEQTANTRRETLIHEPVHKALHGVDYAIGERDAAALARNRPDLTLKNPDSVAFALGFTRDDD
jgi:hypothetical protein